VFHEKYAFSKDDARALEAFMTPMLQILPEKRATAQEMLTHPWLRDV
jgi:serine/threonine-protein kinase SRPK3